MTYVVFPPPSDIINMMNKSHVEVFKKLDMSAITGPHFTIKM